MDLSNLSIGPAAANPAPQADQAPAQAPQPAPAKDLAEIPPVKAVLEGKPPAIYAPDNLNSPLAQTIGKNIKEIGKLGLALYHSPNKAFVLFNPSILHPNDLIAADKAGKLDTVAAPLDSVGADANADQAAQPDAGAPAPAPAAGQPMTKGLTPRAQSKLAGTRIKTLLDDQAPSQQASPGSGRILNQLLTRAV